MSFCVQFFFLHNKWHADKIIAEIYFMYGSIFHNIIPYAGEEKKEQVTNSISAFAIHNG